MADSELDRRITCMTEVPEVHVDRLGRRFTPKQFVVAGQQFGRLTVLSSEVVRIGVAPYQPRGYRAVACRCSCGTEVVAAIARLYSGNNTSCGCARTTTLRRILRERYEETGNRFQVTHGLRKHELYPTWMRMMQRCHSPSDGNYHYYGGRGIQVYPPWRDPSVFLADIERLIGPRPSGMTLDRENNDGNYEPGNVRWATSSEQQRNKRRPMRRLHYPDLVGLAVERAVQSAKRRVA